MKPNWPAKVTIKNKDDADAALKYISALRLAVDAYTVAADKKIAAIRAGLVADCNTPSKTSPPTSSPSRSGRMQTKKTSSPSRARCSSTSAPSAFAGPPGRSR